MDFLHIYERYETIQKDQLLNPWSPLKSCSFYAAVDNISHHPILYPPLSLTLQQNLF